MTDSLHFHGCTPEPLMGYLKALGVFRLLSEQVDSECRAAWQNGHLVLQTKLSEAEIVSFFFEKYIPTPVVVPWSGGYFFNVKQNRKSLTYKKTPTSSVIIEAFLQNTSVRLETYRSALNHCLESLRDLGMNKKEQMKGKGKANFLAYLRTLPSDGLNNWLDAASALPDDNLKLNTLLGSGGGSDGNTHFSDNFMQNLWESLPDFDSQKASSDTRLEEISNESQQLLRNSLFDASTSALVKGRTSSLFDSGAVGGPNTSQGFKRKSLSNPWDFILAIEGCVGFGGSVTKKLGASKSRAVFPFQTDASAIDSNSLVENENSGKEIWLPMWKRSCRYIEIKQLLAEGRSDWKGKTASRGVDFAKAVASLGIDRGIQSFAHYAILKGRVGGNNYNTAVFLDRFEVQARNKVHHLHEVDPWIERYRRACGDKAPARFGTALRQIDSAVFDYCRLGGRERFQGILIALGQAERELSTAVRFREKNYLNSLRTLSHDWVVEADDDSPEFEIAAALAAIRSIPGKIPGIRANMEPVAYEKKGLEWKESSKAYVWKKGDLYENLASALERRVLDTTRLSLNCLPVTSNRSVRPETIAAFIAGELDEVKIESLLWGLICCREIKWAPDRGSRTKGADEIKISEVGESGYPLPRCFALLKATLSGLCKSSLTPTGLKPTEQQDFEKLKSVVPEARLLQLLRANRLPEATTLAAQRLRNKNLATAQVDWSSEIYDDSETTRRLAAALMLPVSNYNLIRLWSLVSHKRKSPETESTQESQQIIQTINQ